MPILRCDNTQKNPQYEWFESYLKDLPAEPWSFFPSDKRKQSWLFLLW